MAARYRDLMAVVKRLGERQDVERPGRGDADAVAVWTDGEHASVCVLPYRAGRLVDKREFHFEGVGEVAVSDLLVTFAAQYYEANPAVPRPGGDGPGTRRRRPRARCRPSSATSSDAQSIVDHPVRGPRARRVASWR